MNEPLPLHPGAKPCVQSGFCCRKSACAFGEWDATNHQCLHLTKENHCGIYAEILKLPTELWRNDPAFGAGCCCPLFNDARDKILRARRTDTRPDAQAPATGDP